MEFQGSKQHTLGVEIELQLIDPTTFDLALSSASVLERCKKEGLQVTAEIHKSMIEVNSDIATDVKQCRQSLQGTLQRTIEIVEGFDLFLSTSGTHPFQQWAEQVIQHSDRYQLLHEKFQWLIRRMNVYAMHVHIGVSSGDRALQLCQAMMKYLPLLLALSANSPYWQGIGTGMQSSRINILDAFPFSGFPKPFTRWEEFSEYCRTLSRVGAITSPKDIYWYIRPNAIYGTVEVRICDAMTKLDETMAVTAFIHCLVHKLNTELDEGLELDSQKHSWIIPENQLIAARDGLSGEIIVGLQGRRERIADEITSLIEEMTPIAGGLNCLEELLFLHEILQKGNGAQRQIAYFSVTNSLPKVVELSCLDFKASIQDVSACFEY
jgi:carboxylate-amine ligase